MWPGWKWVSSPRLCFSENNLCGPSPPPKFSSPSPNSLAKAVSAAVDVSGKEATTGLHLGLPTSRPQASTGGPTPSPMAGLQHSVSLDAGFLLLPLSFSPLDLLLFFQPWRQNPCSKNISQPGIRRLLEIPMLYAYSHIMGQINFSFFFCKMRIVILAKKVWYVLMYMKVL